MQSISTSAVRSSERLDYWRDVVCRVFTRVECKRLCDMPVHGSIVVKEVGAVHLCSTATSSFEYRRGMDQVRAGPSEHFILNYVLSGEAHGCQQDRWASQSVGDMVIFDTARPYLLQYPDNIQKITVQIPRATLLSRLPQAEQCTARTLTSTSPLTRLVGSMLRQLEDEQLPNAFTAVSVGGVLVDALAAALQAEILGPVNRTDTHGSLFKQIQHYILANLGNRDISIEHLAEVHGVGERTINRLFAEQGTTAIRWLWQQRLNATYKALSEGRARDVTDAALEAGFSNLSHFSRAFKKAFGIPPHSLFMQRSAGGRKLS
jgi:AraC-like DNA-binding protein